MRRRCNSLDPGRRSPHPSAAASPRGAAAVSRGSQLGDLYKALGDLQNKHTLAKATHESEVGMLRHRLQLVYTAGQKFRTEAVYLHESKKFLEEQILQLTRQNQALRLELKTCQEYIQELEYKPAPQTFDAQVQTIFSYLLHFPPSPSAASTTVSPTSSSGVTPPRASAAHHTPTALASTVKSLGNLSPISPVGVGGAAKQQISPASASSSAPGSGGKSHNKSSPIVGKSPHQSEGEGTPTQQLVCLEDLALLTGGHLPMPAQQEAQELPPNDFQDEVIKPRVKDDLGADSISPTSLFQEGSPGPAELPVPVHHLASVVEHVRWAGYGCCSSPTEESKVAPARDQSSFVPVSPLCEVELQENMPVAALSRKVHRSSEPAFATPVPKKPSTHSAPRLRGASGTSHRSRTPLKEIPNRLTVEATTPTRSYSGSTTRFKKLATPTNTSSVASTTPRRAAAAAAARRRNAHVQAPKGSDVLGKALDRNRSRSPRLRTTELRHLSVLEELDPLSASTAATSAAAQINTNGSINVSVISTGAVGSTQQPSLRVYDLTSTRNPNPQWAAMLHSMTAVSSCSFPRTCTLSSPLGKPGRTGDSSECPNARCYSASPKLSLRHTSRRSSVGSTSAAAAAAFSSSSSEATVSGVPEETIFLPQPLGPSQAAFARRPTQTYQTYRSSSSSPAPTEDVPQKERLVAELGPCLGEEIFNAAMFGGLSSKAAPLPRCQKVQAISQALTSTGTGTEEGELAVVEGGGEPMVGISPADIAELRAAVMILNRRTSLTISKVCESRDGAGIRDQEAVFKEAHLRVKSLVMEQLQLRHVDVHTLQPGQEWPVCEADVLALPPYRRTTLLKAIQELVIAYDMMPHIKRGAMLTALEVLNNVDNLVFMARVCMASENVPPSIIPKQSVLSPRLSPRLTC